MSLDAIPRHRQTAMSAEVADAARRLSPGAGDGDTAVSGLQLPENGLSSLVHAPAPVQAVAFDTQALPKLGDGTDSLLAAGQVDPDGTRSHEVAIANMQNVLERFRTFAGGDLGPLQAAYDTFEQEVASLGADPVQAERGYFRALVRFGEQARQVQALLTAGLTEAPSPSFSALLDGTIGEIAKTAATINEATRLSNTELRQRVGQARTVAGQAAEAVTAVSRQPLSQQLRQGTMAAAVRELLSEHGYFQRDGQALCDPSGRTLSAAEVDGLADRVVQWAAEKLTTAESRLTEAEGRYVAGLNDEERAAYEQLRDDYEDLKRAIPPRTVREAVGQAYLQVIGQYGTEAVDPDFVAGLMTTQGLAESDLSEAERRFVEAMGTFATHEAGRVRIQPSPEARRYLADAVRLVRHPSSPAARQLVETFATAVGAYRSLVSAVRSLGRHPAAVLAGVLGAAIGGIIPIGRGGKAKRAAGPAKVTPQAGPRQAPPVWVLMTTMLQPGAKAVGVQTPTSTGPQQTLPGQVDWRRRSGLDDQREMNTRHGQERLADIQEAVASDRQAYTEAVLEAGMEAYRLRREVSDA